MATGKAATCVVLWCRRPARTRSRYGCTTCGRDGRTTTSHPSRRSWWCKRPARTFTSLAIPVRARRPHHNFGQPYRGSWQSATAIVVRPSRPHILSLDLPTSVQGRHHVRRASPTFNIQRSKRSNVPTHPAAETAAPQRATIRGGRVEDPKSQIPNPKSEIKRGAGRPKFKIENSKLRILRSEGGRTFKEGNRK